MKFEVICTLPSVYDFHYYSQYRTKHKYEITIQHIRDIFIYWWYFYRFRYRNDSGDVRIGNFFEIHS